jgi:hypothetical protein
VTGWSQYLRLTQYTVDRMGRMDRMDNCFHAHVMDLVEHDVRDCRLLWMVQKTSVPAHATCNASKFESFPSRNMARTLTGTANCWVA